MFKLWYRHPEYRMFLFDHLLNVTLRHWDLSMRQLGAQSLRLICLEELPTLGPKAILKAVGFHSLSKEQL